MTVRSHDIDVLPAPRGPDAARAAANERAVERMCAAEPVLVAVRPASEVVPGLTPETILTSGPAQEWHRYRGGQREAIVGGALFEGLARDRAEAERRLDAGQIVVAPCQRYGCIGSLAGIHTASMPVLVVEDAAHGNRAYCTLFEGSSPHRLNYGVYNEAVRDNLLGLAAIVAPTLDEAVRRAGGVALRPIIRRALHLGDELHSRNTAATLLFGRTLFDALLDLAAERPREARSTVDYLGSGDYVFLRLSMAASKTAADAAHGVPGSSVVTGMAFNCSEFAVRVSGLGDTWFGGGLPALETARLFDGHTAAEMEFMGGESTVNETVGLGAFAQAAAFPLLRYQGGTPERMVAANREMYRITVAEHPEFQIPYLAFRGVPVGIDTRLVVSTGITPLLDIGIAGRAGGQIGAGSFRAPLACFAAAEAAYRDAHPETP
jgi:hypothetical protein